ncbi:zinc-dependent metalloprotease [Pseudotamlana carrageenivorans]|uniref:Secretion system C-terminal sorting domain-containing protein n=1 Tax=Pseudotamlana carrageenivorans TaxID=2069432 RepID=A0A2I7SI64_9FLAO|nr:zinc-dependent metalloprotease [Tamlana carrageenivorans]AUS05577.1 hypothetical protein C1A40_08930 [Tamlana carrageenivorans]
MGIKKNTFAAINFTWLLIFLTGPFVFSQVYFKEIALEQQVEQSELIVEGRVISKKSFWGNDDQIYTKNTIEVYKVFKGESIATVNVITRGGTVGYDCQLVTHSLQLKPKDLGVFVLVKSAKVGMSDDSLFRVYSGIQGFYKYNLYKDVVANALTAKSGIVKGFYEELSAYAKRDYVVVKPFSVSDETSKLVQSKQVMVPTGISFAPTSTTAGTGSTITISLANGATGNFGSAQGKVSFRDADTGGEDDMGNAAFIDALDTQIVGWSPTSIIVEVPAEAGTGTIRVTDANANVIESAADLTITYALLNVVFSVEIGGTSKNYAFPTRLVNNDGSGGYEFKLETSFNADKEHPGAKDNFLTALETWRCETGVNFNIGGVSSVDKADITDGVNIIRFDNGKELPEGTLGNTSYSFTLCGNKNDILNTSEVFPTAIDMVFDNEADWYFGSGSPGFLVDFQGVALHEIGHAHQLGHVINQFNDVMHYSISFGEQIRSLSNENRMAANAIQADSEASLPFSNCFGGKTAMIGVSPANCTLGVISNNVSQAGLKFFPNPTKGVLYMHGADAARVESLWVYDLSGRTVFEKIDFIPSSKEVIDLSSMSKGVYFVKVSGKDGALTKKIILD